MKLFHSKKKVMYTIFIISVFILLCVPAIADGIIGSYQFNISLIYTPSVIVLAAFVNNEWRRFDNIKEGISFGYYLTKRLLDIILSMILIIVTLPISLIIAAIVKIDSDGPIIFRRYAIGKFGKTFPMYKFRTMITNAEQVLAEDEELKKIYYTNCKIENDPRVTGIGKLLRKTSLDELPQLFNVLFGHMTFVGPRPIAEDEIDIYGPAVEEFKKVTPGITGLWQTSGRSNTSYARRVELDMMYIRNRSILLDMWILMKTIPAVLLKRGAV